ncbi:MAG: methionine aminotransferase [Acidobacteria bacterium]|nr:methionine aminotransferase [Acidobacteriota bacterium]
MIQSKLPTTGVSIFSVMSRLADEHGAINLSQGFPDFECAPELVAAVAASMREGHNQYAPMLGVRVLREALSDKIERLYGRRYDPESEITVTCGATEGLFSTLTALVHPGDEVVLLQPAYDAYGPVVQLSGGTPVFVTLRGPDYRVDWDDVRRVVTARTRVIVVNTPHNPTGMVFDRDDLRELGGILERTDAVVVSDEVYEHMVFDGRTHESIAMYPDIADRAVVISSFGKTYHTTGWKIGYCAAPRAISAEVARVHQFVTYAVNGAIQRAYAEFVRRDPTAGGVAPFYQAKRDLFLRLIEGSRFRPLPCRGTYFQMLDYSAISDEQDSDFVLRLITDHGVAAIPLSPFLHGADPGPVLRFCFAKRDETLRQAAERLLEV